jgi:chemotaxis protein methyltransferase CheR
MLRAMTTNVTRFFREPHHFDDLKRLVAEAAPAVRAGARLRLWSAGCSTGQEPYTMAFSVLSVLPEAAELDVKILASDIDTDVLATAKAGIYSAEQPDRAGAWRVSPAPRELIVFRELNLNEPAWPMRGPFDAVFCRNVAIYFDEPTQDRLWRRFAPLMTPEARLYVGHSERVRDPALVACGLTAYRRASITARSA